MRALPTPGPWNKKTDSGNTFNALWNRISAAGVLIFSYAGCSVFYRYLPSLSSNRTMSWLNTRSQFLYRCVHFFITFIDAKYSIFSRAVSLGKELFVFVTLRNWRLTPSMILVVYIILRISSLKWKNGLITSQFDSQLLRAKGYFFPHFSFNDSNSASASSSFGAL